MLILCLSLFVLLLLAILISKSDYMRPSVMVSAVMFMASVASFYLSFIWRINLKIETFLLVFFSVAIFIIVDFVFSRVNKRHKRSELVSAINVNKWLIIIISIFCLVAAIWHYRVLVNNFGFTGSLAMMVSTYRNYLVWGVLEGSIPSVLSRMERMSQNFAFIFLYVFINNLITTKRVGKNIRYLIPTIIYLLDSMLWGARGYIFYIVFASLVYWYIITQKKVGWKQKEKKKFLNKAARYIIIVAVGFVALGTVFGRSSENNIIYRLSTYMGGGIALFNDYLTENTIKSPFFGAATFTAWNNFMTRHFGRVDLSNYYQFEFRSHEGFSWGNVYTALRRYYQDFDFFGTLVMVTILALVFTLLYRYVSQKQLHKGVNFALLYYGILSRALFLFFFDDEFFNDFITPSTLIYLIEMMICFFISDQMNLKLRARHRIGRI